MQPNDGLIVGIMQLIRLAQPPGPLGQGAPVVHPLLAGLERSGEREALGLGVRTETGGVVARATLRNAASGLVGGDRSNLLAVHLCGVDAGVDASDVHGVAY